MSSREIVPKLLGSVVDISIRHPFLVLGTFFALALVFMIPASELEVDTSMEGMFGEEDETIKSWMEINDKFGEQELVTVVVDCEHSNATIAVEYIHDLVPELEATGNFREIEYSLDLSYINKSTLLYLPEESIEGLLDPNITPEEADQMYGAILDEFFKTRYIASEDGRLFLVNMNLAVSMDDVDVRNEVFDGLYDVLDETKEKDQRYDDLDVGFTGGMMVMDYEADNMAMGDMFATAGLTFLLILVILFFSFRSLSLPLLSLIPLVIGIMITAGFIGLIYGNLGFFTMAFIVLLLGLGIAFCIHLLTRFIDEMNKGEDVENALRKTYTRTGKGVILGGLTTSMVFFALNFGKTEAMNQMGVVAALGLFVTMITVFFMLPALTVIRMRHGSLREKLGRKRRRDLNPLGTIGRLTARYSLVIILVMLIVGTFFVYRAPDAEITGDITRIQPKSIPTYKQLEKVVEVFNYTENYVLVTCGSYDELVLTVQGFMDDTEVMAVESILDFMPNDQERKMEMISGALSRSSGLEELGWLQVDPVVWMDIDPDLRSAWVFEGGEGSQFLVRITMVGDIFEEDYREEVLPGLRSVNTNVTSQAQVFSALIDVMTDDVLSVSIFATLPIMLLVYVGFGRFNPIYAIMAFVPVAFGLLGIMALYEYTGIDLNVISIMMAPLIIGIGIDNGIHLIHRYMEEGKGSIPTAVKCTGKAIALTTFTTILAFSSFTIAEHPGIQSLGMVPVLGLTVCFLASLLFLPALMVAVFENRWRKGVKV